MKHGKKPTVAQRKRIKLWHLNPENWLVCKDTPTEMVIQHRLSDQIRTIPKRVADYFGVSVDYLLGRGVYSLSEEAQQYAKQFEELPEEKKKLAMAYMGVVKAQ